MIYRQTLCKITGLGIMLLFCVPVLAVTGPLPPPLGAGEAPAGSHLKLIRTRGALLYQNHCLDCHESLVHIRARHKARNLGAIQGQVIRWSSYLKLRWSEEDINDVTRYLNQTYYQFIE